MGRYYRSVFAELRRRLCSMETAKLVEGKSEDEIRAIYVRKLNEVLARKPELFL